MDRTRLDGTQIFSWLLVGLALVLLWAIVQPFWSALFLAAVLAGVFSGLQRQAHAVARRSGGSRRRPADAPGAPGHRPPVRRNRRRADPRGHPGDRLRPREPPGVGRLRAHRTAARSAAVAGRSCDRGGWRRAGRPELGQGGAVPERKGGGGGDRILLRHYARGDRGGADADRLLLPAHRRAPAGGMARAGRAAPAGALPQLPRRVPQGVPRGGRLHRGDGSGPGRGGAGRLPHRPGAERRLLHPGHVLHVLHPLGWRRQRAGGALAGAVLPGPDRMGHLPRRSGPSWSSASSTTW